MATLKHLGDSSKIRADALGILVNDGLQLTPAGEFWDRKLKGAISKALKQEHFLVKTRNLLTYFTGQKSPRKILCAAAPQSVNRLDALREAAYLCAKSASAKGVKSLALAFDPQDDSEIQAVGEGALLATYQYQKYKSDTSGDSGALSDVIVCSLPASTSALKSAEIFSRANSLVRDLVNEPPISLTPVRFAEIAKDTARESGFQCKIFEQKELQEMGANAFLSVGKGSKTQGRMIHLTYAPRNARMHVALVGKGITFDSGGLSLKPEKGMEHMKSDMAGAATVLACVRAAKELALPLKITGLLMVTENMPDAGANRPGDVIRAMNGKTIEITNTDAEGRLALADGLTYAQTLNPDYLIDIATLTGAQVVSLGRLLAGVVSNNEELTRQLVEAGEKSGELLWPLPLFEPYRTLIKSDIADIRNASGIPEAGTIQAGLFLSEFITHPRWAHLDIAGPAWQEREWSVFSRAASGFSARCLLTFLSEL
jgi:leucyl aminopeptidase